MSIVYTGGTFDMFHAGHVDLLRTCRTIAGPTGTVVVALNRDEFVRKFKGQAPICSFEERRVVLTACRYVDEVIPNSGDQDSTVTIDSVSPDIIVIGQDWASRDYYTQMGFTPDWLSDRGIALVYAARPRSLSSTELKGRVARRE